MTQVEPSPAPRQVYVLDTNVLLHDPKALFTFEEHHVVIPMTVIEEVDTFKKHLNELGRNARTISRYLDKLRERGSLKDGVALRGGGSIKVCSGNNEQPPFWGPDNNDNRILLVALREHEKRGDGVKVTLVTRDANMRLKCDALGVPAEDYKDSMVPVDSEFSGVREVAVDGGWIDALYQHDQAETTGIEGLHPNECVVVKEAEGRKSAVGRVSPDLKLIRPVRRRREGIWGILPRNKEQEFALELLMDDDVKLVTLNGVAGTGKTLLALACGLKKVADDEVYRKLLVSRPIFPLGRDIGFLPGDVEQKLNPWMKPIFDNLELLLSSRGVGKGREPNYAYLLDKKILEVEPLTYIRGRSLPQQYLIVDEAQNLTPHEVKTVLTRAGEGTKVVLTGDPEQIDNPYVDSRSNGLTYVIEHFKDASLAGHVTLSKGERSELAELAARLM